MRFALVPHREMGRFPFRMSTDATRMRWQSPLRVLYLLLRGHAVFARWRRDQTFVGRTLLQ